MKSKSIIFGVCFFLALSLVACKSDKNGDKEVKTEGTIKEYSTKEISTEEYSTVDIASIRYNQDDWKQAYKDYANILEDSIDSFHILDLHSDGIPELYIRHKENYSRGLVYLTKDGVVKEFPIIDFTHWNDDNSKFFVMTSEDVDGEYFSKDMLYTYNSDTLDYDLEFTGLYQFSSIYMIDGEEVSKSDYDLKVQDASFWTKTLPEINFGEGNSSETLFEALDNYNN